MKYIVLRTPGGSEEAVLFPRSFLHRYVADLHAPLEVVSAGFVRQTNGQLECYGASVGLRIASRPEPDSALVNRALAAEFSADDGSAVLPTRE